MKPTKKALLRRAKMFYTAAIVAACWWPAA